MSKLPDTIENDLLNILTPTISEGTIKNRRNLLVASFTVVAVYIIGKSLTDLSIFGLALKGSNSHKLILVAMVLIFFWLFMFVLHAWRDKKINEAKTRILNKTIKKVKDTFEENKQRYEENKENGIYQRDLHISQREMDVYETYMERLKMARWLTIATYTIEYSLPALVSLLALYFLGAEYSHLLMLMKP